MEEVASVAAGAIKGVGQVGSSIIDASKGTVHESIVGVSEIGGDIFTAARKATKWVVTGASEIGGNVGGVAVAAVEGAQ